MLTPIIIAGGSGSRLWPLSRQQFPKQFLNIDGKQTMLQTTLNRLKPVEHGPATVICNEAHRFIVAEQLRQLGTENTSIILEPEGKNTAPAIALAAFHALAKGNDPLLLVLAADHLIQNETAFCAAIKSAEKIASKGKLVTFGIVPTSAETGYGYIRQGSALENKLGFEVAEFVEKPDQSTAHRYFKSGEFLWNSGMFLFQASTFLHELEKHQPDIYNHCELAFANKTHDLDFIRISEKHFKLCPSDSIDYAVMEKTDKAVVIPTDCGWCDVGSWSSLWQVSEKDDDGNVLSADVIAQNCKNSFFRTEGKLIAAIGLENVVVIDTKDATLISTQDQVQNVKKVVAQLKEQGKSHWLHHREVYRPWGKYDLIDGGERFQAKRITVNPGEKLSLQMHHHRAEHWVVVKGTAMVTKGDSQYLVSENESTYIPLGEKHALENPGKVPLEMIEVQSGAYLGEDDIVRFQDNYGRKT